MTREQAINLIRDHMDVHHIGEYPHIMLAVALEMAISALREQQWISVEDRLPENDGKYLVFSKCAYGEIIEMASYTTNYHGFEEYLQGKAIWYDYDSEYGDFEKTGITHWMRLPEPPAEEADHEQ